MEDFEKYRFFLGGESVPVSYPEEVKMNQSAGSTLVRDGLSMDERWARDPIGYAAYMSRKLSTLNRLLG